MPEIDRRDFLKLVGAGAGAAAAAGCSDHVERLIPYVVQPETISPGLPLYYASTCRECPAACGLHVKTLEGRPVKLEGNPENPINRGALCARGQTAIGRTYHPDRFHGPMLRSGSGAHGPISWDAGIELLSLEIAKAPERVHVLGGDPGDTAGKLIDRFTDLDEAPAAVVPDLGLIIHQFQSRPQSLDLRGPVATGIADVFHVFDRTPQAVTEVSNPILHTRLAQLRAELPGDLDKIRSIHNQFTRQVHEVVQPINIDAHRLCNFRSTFVGQRSLGSRRNLRYCRLWLRWFNFLPWLGNRFGRCAH